MKSVVEPCVHTNDLGIKPDSNYKIARTRLEENTEMTACFSKLKELVPTVPQHKKISKVALLQHVIDYILDLETTLDTHPAMQVIPPLAAVYRAPLSEKSDFNTFLMEVGICFRFFMIYIRQ